MPRKARLSAPPAGPVASLAGLSEVLAADKSPREILNLILQAARSITRASSASLMLLEPDSEVLKVEAAAGFKDDRIRNTRLRVGQGVTGWVAETGVALRVGNARRDPRYVRVQSNLRSELAVPLKVRGRVIGVISVDSTRVNHFTAEDEALLLSLAAHSARIIEGSRLWEEAARRAEELRLLIESGKLLAGSLDLDQVLGKLVRLAAEFWRAPLSAVYLLEGEGRQLGLAAAEGGDAEFRRLTPLPVEGTLLGKILHGPAESRPVEDLAGAAAPQVWPALSALGLGSLLAAPLTAKDRRLGVLCIFAAAGRVFSLEERRLLEGLASVAASAIDNAHVHRRAMAAEEALRAAEKSSLVSELAAGLAHEIRNPLTSIRILFESLPRDPAGPSRDLEVIQRQLERLHHIVENYLAGARAHSGRTESRRVDLNGVIEESLLLLASSAQAGARLECRLDPRSLELLGDPVQISQVVHNLVINALQAVSGGKESGGGRVELRTGYQDAAAREIILEVGDDGPGLAPEVRERMFQPFVTTKPQGVGLGLAIVKRIVEQHGGRLEVESPRRELGRGTGFRVIFPAAPPLARKE